MHPTPNKPNRVHTAHSIQEDEGEEDTDFTPMSQDYPGGSRRTFSIDNILPHRAVDPRPMRSSRLGSTPGSGLRGKSSEPLSCCCLVEPHRHAENTF